MRLRVLLVGFISAFLSGCGAPPLKLIAHEGPMATANPGLVIPAVAHGQGNIGTLSFAYPDAAACNGKWERITHRTDPGIMRDDGSVTPHGGVVGSGENGRVFHGDTKAGILGMGDCTDGTTFTFFSMANGYKSLGALKDSHGNMFVMRLR